MKVNIKKAFRTSSVLVMSLIFSFALYFSGEGNTVSAAPSRTWVTQVEVLNAVGLQNAINNAANNVPTLIKLTGDINLDSTHINIPVNKIIKITSKTGTYTITTYSSYINWIIVNSGELWTENVKFKGISGITDMAVSNSSSGKYIMQNGTIIIDFEIGVSNTNNLNIFEMEGGEIYNTSSMGVRNYGNFLMTGGKIYSTSVGVYNHNDRMFTMNGGQIYYNNIGVQNYGSLTVNAGSRIHNNNSQYTGGGITNYGGTVAVTGGQISNNTGKNGGAISNVKYNNSTGTVTISNAIIANNTALSDGGAIYTDDYSKLIVSSVFFYNNRAASKFTGNPTTADQVIHNSNVSGGTYTTNNPAFQWLYNNYDVNYTAPVIATVSARSTSSLITVSADAALGMPSLSTAYNNILVKQGSTYRPAVSLKYPGLTYSVYLNGIKIISESTAANPSIAITKDSVIDFILNDRQFSVDVSAQNRPQGGGPMTVAALSSASKGGVTTFNIYYSPTPWQLLLQDGTSIPFTASVDSSGHRIVSYTLNPYAWSPSEAAQKGFVSNSYSVRVIW